MKLTYEMLPESAQKAYNVTNKVRTVSMFIAIILSFVFIIIFFPSLKDDMKDKSFISILFVSLFQGVFAGGLIHGLIHEEMLLKPLMKNFLKSLLKIYFPPIPIIHSIILGVGMSLSVFIGAPCMIIDLILYLKKKPLVYSFEIGSFLKLKAVQEEIQAKAMQEMNRPQEDAQTKLTKLKQMLDNGLITEDEYNQKKAELLSHI